MVCECLVWQVNPSEQLVYNNTGTASKSVLFLVLIHIPFRVLTMITTTSPVQQPFLDTVVVVLTLEMVMQVGHCLCQDCPSRGLL